MPAVAPPFGRLAAVTFTATVVDAAPLFGVTVSQFPPSDVLGTTVQFSVPVPAFRICITWLAGFPPLAFTEKCNAPGTLSKNGAFDGAMVRVTGIFTDAAVPLPTGTTITSPV